MTTRVRRNWAEFMQDALYDPRTGFFTNSPVGRHFATAPTLSPVFGACIASLLANVEARVGEDTTFLEVAAGDGTLCAQVAASAPELAKRVAYIGVDQDRSAIERANERPAPPWRAASYETDIASVPALQGLIFANELFDNIPFHRLMGTAGGVREIFVEATSDGLQEVLGDVGVGVREAASRNPRAGEELPSSPQALALIRDLIGKLTRGWIVTIDYGVPTDGSREPVRGYRDHVRVDPLVEPEGTCDITGPVDFAALANEARSPGARTTEMSQSAFLVALGYPSFLSQMEARLMSAQQQGDVSTSIRMQQAIDQASVLIDPDELGSFTVLIAAIGDVPDLPFP